MEPLSHSDVTRQPRLRDALNKVRPEMDALRLNELLPINLDPVVVGAILQGSLRNVLPQRDRIARTLLEFPIASIDNLELYALALIQAQAAYHAVNHRYEKVPELVAEARKLRERLLVDVKAVVARKLVSSSVLGNLQSTKSHHGIALDVMALASVLRNHWEQISTRTAATLEELDRAEVFGDQLFLTVGQRKLSPEDAAKAELERRQAYTLAVRAYDEVRRVFTFLRWHEGDVDSLVPSLYGGRKVPKRTKPAEATENAKVEMEPADAAVSGASSEPAVGIGLPGADPFEDGTSGVK